MKVSNLQLSKTVQPQQKIGLTPSSQSWVDAISKSLNIEQVPKSNRYNEPSVVLDISQKAMNSKYWNQDNSSLSIINKEIQSYTRDLTLVSKNLY